MVANPELIKELDEANEQQEQYEELEREYVPLVEIRTKLKTLNQLNEGMREYAKAFPDKLGLIKNKVSIYKKY